jgi:hypothetical protein
VHRLRATKRTPVEPLDRAPSRSHPFDNGSQKRLVSASAPRAADPNRRPQKSEALDAYPDRVHYRRHQHIIASVDLAGRYVSGVERDGIVAVTCSDCGIDRADLGIPPPSDDNRSPCPQCGSIALLVDVQVYDEMTIKDYAQVAYTNRAETDGRTKVVVKGKLGSEFYRKDGRWHRVERRIDKANDWYDEVITDEESGVIVREVHEPLSQHQGRGSDRRPPTQGLAD